MGQGRNLMVRKGHNRTLVGMKTEGSYRGVEEEKQGVVEIWAEGKVNQYKGSISGNA